MVDTETKIQRYESYKASGVEWLGEIPEHWELTRLKNIFFESLEQNKDGKCKFNLSLLKDIGVIPFSEKGNKGNKSSLDTRNYRLVRKGDIVLNTTNVCIGSVGLSRYDGCMSSVMYIVLRPHVELNIKYYDYIFKVRGFQKYLRRISNGILEVREYLNKTLFMAEPMIIPPLPEQTAIAQFLDDKTTKIDQAIAIKQQQIALLKERKQILIHKAVTRGLNDNVALKDSGVEWIGEIPEQWEIRRFKFLCDITTGSKNTEDKVENGDYPFYVRSQTPERINSYSFDGEAILTAGDGAGVGKVFHYVNGKFDFHQRVYKFSQFRKVFGKYLFYYLKSEFFNVALNGEAKSTVDSLRLPLIQNFIVTVPSVKEQEEILSFIDESSAKIETAMSLKEQEIIKLQEYKSSLINSVVTGKVRVC